MSVQFRKDIDDGSRAQYDNGVRLKGANDEVRVAIAVDVHSAGKRVSERRQRTSLERSGRPQFGGGDALGVDLIDAGRRASENVDCTGTLERRTDHQIYTTTHRSATHR
jgi:hypothetical protein